MKKLFFLLPIMIILIFSACSINKFATRVVADALTGTGGSSTFMTDDDPEFIAAALPFALKTFESLLQSDPDHIGLLEASASGYVSYANGFLQSPAELMGYEQETEKEKLLLRAMAMYRRGRQYANRGLELLYPELSVRILNNDLSALTDLDADAVPFLYWQAAALLGEFSIDTFNPSLMIQIPNAVALAVRAFELDEDYNNGALHNLFISVFANIPESLIYSSLEAEDTYSVRKVLDSYYQLNGYNLSDMTVQDQVLYHFNVSVEISGGTSVSPYVSVSSIYIKKQDSESFKSVLNKAINIDINLNPENKLQNIISQRKARWLLDHIDDYFFIL